MAANCEAGRRFSKCGNPASRSCNFCGRRFCDAHTGRAEGHDEVCSREVCRRKDADLAVHVEYKASVRGRNASALCGQHECERRDLFQCSLCKGMFCAKHLEDRQYRFAEGWGWIERSVSICGHCWRRRKIWAK